MEPNEPFHGDSLDTLSATDRSLIEMIRAGDQDAASQLYDRYARRVFGLVKSKLGARLAASTEPDDIVQSVFRSVFRGMQAGNYDAPEGATLWNLLAVIAVRKLANRANHFSAQCRDVARNEPIENASLPTTMDHASIAFLELCLRETLDELREFDREVLTLRIQNYSVDEISELTGRAKRSIERSLQNSRLRFSDLLIDGE